MNSTTSFEFKKKYKQPKNVILIIMFLLFSIIFIEYSHNKEKQQHRLLLQSVDATIATFTNEIEIIKDSVEYCQSQDFDCNDLFVELSNKEEMFSLYTSLRSSIQKGDWKEQLQLEMGIGRKEDMSEGELLEKQYLYDHDIKPVFANYNMQGIHFLRSYFNKVIPFIFTIFIYLLCTDTFCIEKEDEYDTFKLYLTFPIAKQRIVSSKLFIDLSTTLITILISTSTLFIYTMIRFGLGDLNYPFVFIDSNFFPFKNYILIIVLCTVAYTIMATVFANMISIYSKQNIHSLVKCLSISILFFIINKVFFPIMPLTFANHIEAITNHESLFLHLFLECLYSVVIIYGINYVFNKKEQ